MRRNMEWVSAAAGLCLTPMIFTETIVSRCPEGAPAPGSCAPPGGARPTVGGKFFYAGGHKLYICGVTYGPFVPQADGSQCGTPQSVRDDFALMAASGVNAVRVY